jgi:hypothetical protein
MYQGTFNESLEADNLNYRHPFIIAMSSNSICEVTPFVGQTPTHEKN